MSSAPPDPKEFVSDVERLALKAVMLAENDLPALGVFLNDLDGLNENLAGCGPAEVVSLLAQMGEVTDRLALNQIQAAARLWKS